MNEPKARRPAPAPVRPAHVEATPADDALRFVSCGGEAACAAHLDSPALLGGVLFGNAPPVPAIAARLSAVPVAAVRIPILGGEPRAGEFWFGSAHPQGGTDAATGVRYRHDERFLFGLVELPDPSPDGTDGLQAASELAYRRIFALMDTLAYPHLIRCWNYIADINGEAGGLERYRQFNVGRQDAFAAAARAVAGSVPAACALGTRDGGLTVFFLAAREPSTTVENPRQVSAYRYPPDYGPRSPTFSRAALLALGGHSLLFVSGTASIVGHQTIHPGDVRAQASEALANVETVVAEANRHGDGARFSPETLDYRVYLRHAADLPAVRTIVEARLGAGGALPRLIYLEADICRQDLLVEFEATGCSTG